MNELDFIWNALEAVRKSGPLILSVTNYVAANLNANALLAVGASPIMSHQVAEIEDLVTISSAVVVNMGIPADTLPEALYLAGQCANTMGKPLIFDPVGAGASSYRNKVCNKLLTTSSPDIIRGNASEIMALAGQSRATKGVDSLHGTTEASSSAIELAKQYNCTVCVSGAVDLITDGNRSLFVGNGHSMMPRITGLGCTATALAGAFAAVVKDKVDALTSCMAILGIAGEIAAESSNGPGSLQIGIVDKLFNISREEIEMKINLSM
ncbi:hydroxyethylthiazole kinase [Pseudodesulfovibrio sp. zrk46]|uniref:hydroxyethylthiazole kinase n=1 Tax=Pseudodesulfovibrio sp. zrk46 TaxID=2725288 RepID=UPI001449F273|nr:hydroxyethylthiazole kinase [Pseudodesulfovibrio sp. zrk46]QJB57541.1 hydroxyethylthiazole kinase [Pseudodesulfovibrio sp. zrk46]